MFISKATVPTSHFKVSNLYFVFCPNIDGCFLAVGSHDNFIYIYSVTDGGRRYTRFGKCTVSMLGRMWVNCLK